MPLGQCSKAAKRLSEYLVRCLYGIGQIAVVRVTVKRAIRRSIYIYNFIHIYVI